jgi:hypothetical protein
MKGSDVGFAVVVALALFVVAFAIAALFVDLTDKAACLQNNKVCVETTGGYKPYPPEGTEDE